MESTVGKNKNKIQGIEVVSGILLAVTMLIIYFANTQMPFILDDIWYGTNLVTGEELSSLEDVIESQIWHFYNWGGRSTAHFFLQLILMCGEGVADILNVVATVTLAYVMCKLSGTKSMWGILAAVVMLFGFNGDFRHNLMWQSGALNYLYISIFIFFYLWCYLREDLNQKLFGIAIWIIPLGLIAGWSNENMGPMAWILSLVIIIWQVIKKEKIRPWMILGNISCLIGSVLVVMAPGNFVRSNEVTALETRGALWQAFLRCYAECNILFQSLFYAVILVVVLGLFATKVMHIKFGRNNWLLLLGALLSWGAMILSPHYPVRASFGTLALLICVILSLLQKMKEKDPQYVWIISGVIGIAWFRTLYVIGQYLAEVWGWLK